MDSPGMAPRPPAGPPPSFAPRMRPFGAGFGTPTATESIRFPGPSSTLASSGRGTLSGYIGSSPSSGISPRPPSGVPPANLVMPRGGVGMPMTSRATMSRPSLQMPSQQPLRQPTSTVVALPPISVSPVAGTGLNLPGQILGDETPGSRASPSTNKNINFGLTSMQARAAPYGTLLVTVQGCKGLTKAAAEASSRSYVRVRIGPEVKRTEQAREGGARPRYGDELSFDVRNDKDTTIEVVAHQGEGDSAVDVVLATARASIMPWIARGKFAGEIELRDAALQPCGSILISTSYEASDVTREALSSPAKAPVEASPQPGSPASTKRTVLRPPPAVACPFTDDEIKDAFVAFDLDKNNFIGAAEIRHILTCIGETVTDEEVDEMIRMVDKDGDGQVSFHEFYAMVTGGGREAPGLQPAAVESASADGSSVVAEKADATLAGTQAPEPQVDTATLLQQRNLRKQAMEKFVRLQALTMTQVTNAWAQFLVKDKLKDRRIEFPLMCQLLDVEPTPDASEVFNLYDIMKKQGIHFGEFVLGALCFVPCAKPERIKFAFDTFDSNADGSISKVSNYSNLTKHSRVKQISSLLQAELVHILRGNHMAVYDKEVIRKADTIMETADGDKDGFITFEEFVRVAERFPKILFPSGLSAA